jgi:hypothetical protein
MAPYTKGAVCWWSGLCADIGHLEIQFALNFEVSE